MVSKTEQRADFNVKDFLVLKVGDIYSLVSDETEYCYEQPYTPYQEYL